MLIGPDRSADGVQIGRRSLLGAAGAGTLSALAGCATPERGPPVPVADTSQATVLGVPNERFIAGTAGFQALEGVALAAFGRVRRYRAAHPQSSPQGASMLAVSGGGEVGAFGAGVLCGWTEHGTRPEFVWVTGVSTGALTAPFAFLGSGYDDQLRTVFTQTSPHQVLSPRNFSAALFDDAMADNAPLFATVSRFINEAMLADLARAYEQGRILLIGTTNLDAQLPVIWNVGAIASSGHPRALDLIRRIMLASAAIPGAFPPVMIDVTIGGRSYQEMHVDGGTFAQAFLYPAALGHIRRDAIQRGTALANVEAYIIRNARLDPEWAVVNRKTLDIAGRAISTMIAASGINDVIRLYNQTQRDSIGFNLAYLGADFTRTATEPFEQAFMQSLFDYGYQRSRVGYPWAKRPPI